MHLAPTPLLRGNRSGATPCFLLTQHQFLPLHPPLPVARHGQCSQKHPGCHSTPACTCCIHMLSTVYTSHTQFLRIPLKTSTSVTRQSSDDKGEGEDSQNRTTTQKSQDADTVFVIDAARKPHLTANSDKLEIVSKQKRWYVFALPMKHSLIPTPGRFNIMLKVGLTSQLFFKNLHEMLKDGSKWTGKPLFLGKLTESLHPRAHLMLSLTVFSLSSRPLAPPRPTLH